MAAVWQEACLYGSEFGNLPELLAKRVQWIFRLKT